MDDLKIRRKCEDMIAYGHVVLRQFPKAERHVLCAEIRWNLRTKVLGGAAFVPPPLRMSRRAT